MEQLNSISGFFFDTTNTISCDVNESILEQALLLCEHYEKKLSRFVPQSEVWRLNHAEGAPVEVGEDTLLLLSLAERVRKASGGAFNIAIGTVASLWNFNSGTAAIPRKADLETAQDCLRNAVITVNGTKVSVPPNTVIDLGGIAKGFICDCVREFLCQAGATRGILNFGGNVNTIGLHPEGRPWQVGIQTPAAERNQSIFAAIESSDTSVVTSGVYERAFVLEGRLYHHIIDPRTCYPVESSIVSATVVSEDGMLADALSTALLILGEEEGFALVAQFGAEALTLNLQGSVRYTENLPIILP